MDTQQATVAEADAVETEPVDVDDAEAALVEHYPRLVRIAYVTLPATMGRHRRVLLAHRLVQRALPRTRRSAADAGPDEDPAYVLVRHEVLRGALAYGRRLTGWRRWTQAVLVAAPLPPQVMGLRLFPRAGDDDELALDRTLAELDAPARAAYALRGIEGLDDGEAAALLAAVGVAGPRKAVYDAATAAKTVDTRALASAEFDPCVVHARPTDLMRRRQHVRAGAAVAVAAVAAVGLLGVPGDGDSGGFGASGPLGPQQAALNRALDPAGVVRADPDAWTRTSRLDFSSWPARGDRTDDRGLLQRALGVWARPGSAVRVSATPGTAQTPPVTTPQLLFAGDVDGAGVVLLYDGLRVVRYAEPVDGGGAPVLDFARIDGASGASASAVVIGRSDANARYLAAPWIGRVELRNLLRPDAAARVLRRSADGVTDPVPVPGADGACGTNTIWTAVRLTPKGVPDQQPFLLTDLAELTLAHLTYATGAGARQGEVNDPQSLGGWAHAACRLTAVRGEGVRTVGNWQFADQKLPDGAGTANWLCTRADAWSGPGRVAVQFVPPGAAAGGPADVVAQGQSTAACGPLSPGVLSGVLWKSPVGHWYLVAAGSPELASITAGGDLQHTEDDHTMAVPAKPSSHPQLTGRLADGSTLAALS